MGDTMSKGNNKILEKMSEFDLYKVLTIIVWILFFIIGPIMAFSFTVMSVDSVMTEDYKIKKGYLYIAIYVFIGIAYFLWFNHKESIKEREDKITHLDKENTEQREILKDNAKALWKEMTKINIHAHNQNVINIFEKFIMNHPNVIAVELYDYYTQDGSNSTKDVTIKINHSLGYVMENKNQNTILQDYYHIPKALLDKFKIARKMFKVTDSEEGKMELFKFFSEIRTELSGKNIEEYNRKDVIKFALLVLAAGLINDWFKKLDDAKVRRVELLNDEEKTQALFEKSKTGILRGILDNGQFYAFNYMKRNSVSEKEERLYITKRVLMRGKPSIFVITVDNNGNVDEKMLMESFIRLMFIDDTIQVEYNKNKDH